MKKKALLVGIDKYPDPLDGLRGCVNDVRLMAETLRAQYGFTGRGDIRVLTDSRATTGAILDGLSWLAAGSVPGDSLLFHYSGHGSQVPDERHGDETSDGLDEILCPYDLDWDRPLTDDHLAAACAGIPRGALLTVILDCCHSGTGLRAPGRPCMASRRRSPIRARFLRFPGRFPGSRRAVRRFGVSVRKTDAVLLAACREDQTCADAPFGASFHGAHTYYLCGSLKRANWIVPYRTLAASMRDAIARAGYDQVPQLEGPARILSSRFLEPPLENGPGDRPGRKRGSAFEETRDAERASA